MRRLCVLCFVILCGFNQKSLQKNRLQVAGNITSETNAKNAVTDQARKPPYPVVYTNLMVSDQGKLSLVDGVAAGFDNSFSAGVDGDDATKLWNFTENIALIRDGKALAIEFRPFPVLTDTLFYRLYLKQRPYTLQIYSRNFAGVSLRAWLLDKYLNKRTAVNLHDTTLYNFIPNADTDSYRNRFMLVYNRQFTATAVPVTKTTNTLHSLTTGNVTGIDTKTGGISVYPNPIVAGGAGLLRFNNMDAGQYEVTVYNPQAQKVTGFKIRHNGGDYIYQLPVNPSWVSGIYTINIVSQNFTEPVKLQLVIGK
jgi:hypothetical protein